MQGHEPFPDMDSFHDEAQIVARFVNGQFPEMGAQLLDFVTHSCWSGRYDSVEAILHDLASGDLFPLARNEGEEGDFVKNP